MTMKLMGTQTNTTCPYCGTGCGVVATTSAKGEVSITGDTTHPANFGRLCSKGTALADTLDMDGRLLYPEIGGQRVGWDAALDAVSTGLRKIIDQHGPDAVAFYVSGQLLTEDYYVVNKLAKGYIGTANIDTNSRLCMASSVAGHKRAFGSDSVPCSYEDLERAKLIVLVGSNTAWCHPVLYQRIVKAKKDNPDLMVVVIDPRRTATCDGADLHLPLTPGSDAVLFNGLLHYLHAQGETNALFTTYHTHGLESALAAAAQSSPDTASVVRACGLEPELIDKFFRLFARTERVVTVYSQGINQSSSGTDKVNAIINCHLLTGRIGRTGMGPFSLTGQPNAMGGREVGGLANQLAAHMAIENAAHRRLVQKFWNAPTIAAKAGHKAVDLYEAIERDAVKAVWIMGTNPVVSLPDADRVRAALGKCELVVVSDCIRDTDTTRLAHIRLPALAWGEKDGTVTNSERCISRQRAFLAAPGEAKPDWWAACQVAQRLGHGKAFSYDSPAQIFREHAALSGYYNNGERDFDISGLTGLDEQGYADLMPLQWPITATAPQGSKRLFSDGKFYTADGRAHFIAVTPQMPRTNISSAHPLRLNTGRVRDQWHTMTRTGKSPRLSSHDPEPYVAIHPAIARQHGIVDGALARVRSPSGEIIVRSEYIEGQNRDSLFIPMHWNDQYAALARVNTLVAAHTDPVSGQPESKHAICAIEPYAPAWHGLLLSRRHLAVDTRYWSVARGTDFWRYRLAGDKQPTEWAGWSRALLCAADQEVGWIEYFDPASGRYRAARLVNGRLESCLFIDPTHELPQSSWLESLFKKETLSSAERNSLLSGRPAQAEEDTGPIVCACHGVGLNAIQVAIGAGARTVEAIGKTCKAGTGCGSCLPEIKQLLHSD